MPQKGFDAIRRKGCAHEKGTKAAALERKPRLLVIIGVREDALLEVLRALTVLLKKIGQAVRLRRRVLCFLLAAQLAQNAREHRVQRSALIRIAGRQRRLQIFKRLLWLPGLRVRNSQLDRKSTRLNSSHP